MEEQPPPYPGAESQKKPSRTHVINLVEAVDDPDLAINCHSHQLLVSTIDKDGILSSTVLHYWNVVRAQSSSASSLAIPTRLGLTNLKSIRGFQDLGTWQIPVAKAADVAERHNYLSCLVADRSKQEPPASDETEIISRIMDRLHRTSAPPDSVSVRLGSISVLGDGTEALFTGGPAPVWKWAKPESAYDLKSGFWETELDRAIMDGEWAAGGALLLLVQGVSEKRKEQLMHLRVRFPARD